MAKKATAQRSEALANTPTVLLIEDRKEDAELTLSAFRENEPNWKFRLARDANEATSYMQSASSGQESYPDLILLDLNLPGKDGRRLLVEFRKDPNLQKIPIIVMTGSRSEEDIETCHVFGASSFIFKPINWDQYRAMVGFVGEFWKSHADIPPVWVNSLGSKAKRPELDKTPLIAATQHLLKAMTAANDTAKELGWCEVLLIVLNLKYAWEALTSFGDEEIRAETGLHPNVERVAPWLTSRLDQLEKQLIQLEGKVADLAYEMESFSKSERKTKSDWLRSELKEMTSSLKNIIAQENQIILDQYTEFGQPG